MSIKFLLYYEVEQKKNEKSNVMYDTQFYKTEEQYSIKQIVEKIESFYGTNLNKTTVRDISAAEFLYEGKPTKYTATVYLKSIDKRDVTLIFT